MHPDPIFTAKIVYYTRTMSIVNRHPFNLDIRHKDPEMLADISLKTKKNQKKFPGALFFNFLFATLTTAICLSQGV